MLKGPLHTRRISIHVPEYHELAIKEIWPKFKSKEFITDYFPNYSDSQYPDRDFFYAVLCTIFPSETKELISEARSRRASQNDPDQGELVEIDPEVKANIMSVLNYPSKYRPEFTLIM
jgi:hypothetical protein